MVRLGSPALLALTISSTQVIAHKHHILVGNFGTDYNVTKMLDGSQDVGDGYLYTLLLDADQGTLELVATSKAQSAHPWISLNVSRCFNI